MNDDCDDAIIVTLNEVNDCSIGYIFNQTNATGDPDWSPNEFCDDNTNDIWYEINSVNDLESIKLEIIDSQDPDFLTRFELFKGADCETMVSIDCGILRYNSNEPEKVYINLIPGTSDSYKLRLSEYHFMGLADAELCLSKQETPLNDECVNAIPFNQEDPCASFYLQAASSSEEDICAPNSDVWYTWVWEESVDAFSLSVDFKQGVSIYAGDCNQFELIYCNPDHLFSSMVKFENPDLQGKTLYFAMSEIISYTQVEYLPNNFCIIESTSNNAQNNFCRSASLLELDELGTCSNYMETAEGKNFSGIFPECLPSGSYLDYWHKFVVPEEGMINYLANDPFTWWDFSRYFAFYKGTCKDLELIECFKHNDASFGWLGDLTDYIGDTIYVQAIRNSGSSTDIEFCVIEVNPSLIPDNDNCDSAEAIDIEDHSCDSVFIANNLFSSTSNIDPDCNDSHKNDVWYSFILPSSGELIIETKKRVGSNFQDGGMAIYSGSCNNITLIECNDNSGDGLMPAIHLSEPGLQNQKLFVQFWGVNATQVGEFGICFREPPLSIADFCEEAIYVVESDSCDNHSGEVFSMAGNHFSGIHVDCHFQIAKDMWFEFSYKKGERLVFRFEQYEGSPVLNGKAALYRKNCDDLEFLTCRDNEGTLGMPLFDLQYIIEDEFDEDQNFYIQFWDVYNDINGQFSYCLYDKDLVSSKTPALLDFNIFPNPFNDALYIDFSDNDLQGTLAIELFDLQGRLVRHQNTFYVNGSYGLIWNDLSDLAQGSYILKIQSDKTIWTQKLIKM